MKTMTPIDTGWRLRCCDWREGQGAGYAKAQPGDGWWDATVPGDIHLDCLREGVIPDPFVGANMDRCTWTEDKDWWYRLDFTAPERQAGRHVFLLFEGLDTFATVFLNGGAVASHRNMFTPLRVDVTSRLRKGVNQLAVCLESTRFAARADAQPEVAGNPPLDRLYTRKAQACYGWDIAPRLVTCGIWRPAWLEVTDTFEVAGVSVRTLRATAQSALVEACVEVAAHDVLSSAQVSVELSADGQTVQLAVDCSRGAATVRHKFTIAKPRLWWPHNHGSTELYRCTAKLRAGTEVVDEAACEFGIRTVELVQEPQADGATSFLFSVNGKPVFLKGMNWTPPDAIYARVDTKRLEELVQAAVDANINAFRVWGGGYYEGDAFYDLCDRAGILVWQDFMFACGCYPQDSEFLAEVKAEAEHVVRRLRRHPCLLAWCGDNECDWLGQHYGVPHYSTNRLTKELLPGIVRKLCPGVPYVPSSPFSPRQDDQNSDSEGDVHLWAHGTSYSADFYLKRHPRMVTEIGHISMPDMEVVRSFVPPQELWPVWNDTWRLHSADPRRVLWNKRLTSMFESIKARGWEAPTTLEDLVAKTQKLQAEATAAWLRHFGALPDCWGTFLWNLADCWPQVSDAYIAYPFRPKPALQVVREEYAKIRR